MRSLLLEVRDRELEEELPPAASRDISEFWLPDTESTGLIDVEALEAHLAQVDGDRDTTHVSAYDRELCLFVERRVREARMVQAFYCWPDDVPWNRQPWWLLRLWEEYWAGEAEGHR